MIGILNSDAKKQYDSNKLDYNQTAKRWVNKFGKITSDIDDEKEENINTNINGDDHDTNIDISGLKQLQLGLIQSDSETATFDDDTTKDNKDNSNFVKMISSLTQHIEQVCIFFVGIVLFGANTVYIVFNCNVFYVVR